MLRSGINIDDPVTKYLPSLADDKSLIQWENITLGALAGQVAGVVPNCASASLQPSPPSGVPINSTDD